MPVKGTVQAVKPVGLVSGLIVCNWGIRRSVGSGKPSWKFGEPLEDGEFELEF